jgi:formate C-acetyltransferase
MNVRDFIQENYTEYLGDGSFLSPITPRTEILLNKCKELLKQEQEHNGVLDIDTSTFAGINNFAPGYIDKKNELIVGL